MRHNKTLIKLIEGSNGFYWLMSALENAARENDLNSVEAISAVITQIIEKCDDQALTENLIARLSEKRTSGPVAGINGLYLLMSSLRNAAHNTFFPSVQAIGAVITKLIEKCDHPTLMEKLIAGLSEKSKSGDNGFYWLMNSLDFSTQKSDFHSLEAIRAVITKLIETCDNQALIENLIEKCDHPLLTEKLIDELSKKITEGDETKGFYLWMFLLDNASFKGNFNSVQAINAVISKIIDKCNDQALTEKLIAALSEKRISGDNIGANGFYWLMSSLERAIFKGDSSSVQTISTVISQIIEKCDKPTLTEKLIAGLSEKRTSGDKAGTNGFYWLMASLNHAAIKGDFNLVQAIGAVITQIVEKCDNQALTEKLIEGLVEKRTSVKYAGTNGFYWLMASLTNAILKGNLNSVQSIITLIEKIHKKIANNQPLLIINLLEKGILQKILDSIKKLESNDPIKNNILQFLMGVLSTTDVNSLDESTKKGIFAHKNILKESVMDFLIKMPLIEEIQAATKPTTLLGALIDHQAGFIKSRETETRKSVEDLIETRQKSNDLIEVAAPEEIEINDKEPEAVAGTVINASPEEQPVLGTLAEESLSPTNESVVADSIAEIDSLPPSYESVVANSIAEKVADVKKMILQRSDLVSVMTASQNIVQYACDKVVLNQNADIKALMQAVGSYRDSILDGLLSMANELKNSAMLGNETLYQQLIKKIESSNQYLMGLEKYNALLLILPGLKEKYAVNIVSQTNTQNPARVPSTLFNPRVPNDRSLEALNNITVPRHDLPMSSEENPSRETTRQALNA